MSAYKTPWRIAPSCFKGSRVLSRTCKRYFSYDEAVRAQPTLFTFNTKLKNLDRNQLIRVLRHQWNGVEPSYTGNTNDHDAAVVLASPGFAKLLTDKTFLEDLAGLLGQKSFGRESGSAVKQFHLVAAVVDRIHQIALSDSVDEGISILRSHRQLLLPKMWDSVAPRDRQDADAVSALTFDFPTSESIVQKSVTMPLSRTLFENGRPSTLLTAKFDMTKSSPKLIEMSESHTHAVNMPARSFDYWAPLLPLTPAREVTQSFGNIVREVQVDSEAVPASTELEDAIINKMAGFDFGLPPGSPVSVFAVVTPPSSDPAKAPEPALGFKQGSSVKDVPVVDQVYEAAEYVQQILASGGRIFKILSGGGGWGKKKGLLSLDPQRSHFSPPEEEALDSLVGMGVDDVFAPPGSKIQFFAACPVPPPSDQSDEISVLGVSGDCSGFVGEDPELGRSVCGGFGASSDQSVYVGVQGEKLKLSVPGSCIMLPVRM